MLLLVRDVMLHAIPCRGAHGEGGITLLPGERPRPDFLVHPGGRCFLEFTHHVREAVGGLEANEQMDVIGHTADTFRETAEAANSATEVIVQTGAPCGVDAGHAIFGTEDEVIM